MLENKKTRFIFVTGGVLSSLGKGLASASLAALLQARGYSVRLRKMDPYLNVDPGTMSPYEHGEVYVTDDGAEADLDLGHYERFTGVSATRNDSTTTGKIYSEVIAKERRGDYLGGTVQVIPHITDMIKSKITSHLHDEDFLVCEIGGTVGDIEGLPYIEAIRQLRNELGRDRTLFLHLTLLPYIASAGELKTKPSQHSVKELQGMGIQPDVLMCRCAVPIPTDAKQKLGRFCNVPEGNVVAALDVDTIYQVPSHYHEEGLDRAVCNHFGLPTTPEPDLSQWQSLVKRLRNPEGTVTIAVVGKYIQHKDAYKSLGEALIHGGIQNNVTVNILWIDAEEVSSAVDVYTERLKSADGILVPGGFGTRGTEGKIKAIEIARTNNIPYLGICFGMQLSVIEFARNVLGLKDANSSELAETENPTVAPIVGLITEWHTETGVERRQEGHDLGGSMRLGSYDCVLQPGTRAAEAYGVERISERHRHRYEVNISYMPQLAAAGMILSGVSPDGQLPEIVEIKEHPWFVGVQFHPELKSRPFEPHPLFVAFIKASLTQSRMV